MLYNSNFAVQHTIRKHEFSYSFQQYKIISRRELRYRQIVQSAVIGNRFLP